MERTHGSVGVAAEDGLERTLVSQRGLDEQRGDADGVGAVDDRRRTLAAPHQGRGRVARRFVLTSRCVGGSHARGVETRAGDLTHDAVGSAGDDAGASAGAVDGVGLVDGPERRHGAVDDPAVGDDRPLRRGAFPARVCARVLLLERRGGGASRGFKE